MKLSTAALFFMLFILAIDDARGGLDYYYIYTTFTFTLCYTTTTFSLCTIPANFFVYLM